MIDRLDQIAMICAAAIGSWPAFAFLLTACIGLFAVLVPGSKAPIFRHVGTQIPHKVLDEYFPTWTPQIAERFLAAIGPEGRSAYRSFYLVMDFWFPGAVASLATASLLLIAFPPASGWAWLCGLALPAWLFDIAENVTHFRMAGRYPVLSARALRFGPWFTRGKWVSAILPLPVALTGLLLRLVVPQ